MMLYNKHPLIVESTRGGIVEKEYLIDVFSCDSRGNILISMGDVERLVYPRSSIKIIQALDLIESGAADRYGLGAGELALTCASHRGEVSHVAAAQSILAKAGLRPDHLCCGSEWPSDKTSRRNMFRAQRSPTPVHHNCSGKHAGGLCLLCHQGETVANYTDPDHPLQRQILRNLEKFTGDSFRDTPTAIDGCSYPTYARSLTSWGTVFARIANPTGFDQSTQNALHILKTAVEKNPLMVAGEQSFISMFTRQFGSRVYIKNGADGFMAAAINNSDIGLVLKVRSGQKRIASIAVSAMLEHLGVLTTDEAVKWRSHQRVNANGHPVGVVQTAAF